MPSLARKASRKSCGDQRSTRVDEGGWPSAPPMGKSMPCTQAAARARSSLAKARSAASPCGGDKMAERAAGQWRRHWRGALR